MDKDSDNKPILPQHQVFSNDEEPVKPNRTSDDVGKLEQMRYFADLSEYALLEETYFLQFLKNRRYYRNWKETGAIKSRYNWV